MRCKSTSGAFKPLTYAALVRREHSPPYGSGRCSYTTGRKPEGYMTSRMLGFETPRFTSLLVCQTRRGVAEVLADFRKRRFQQSVKALFIGPPFSRGAHDRSFFLNVSIPIVYGGPYHRRKYYEEMLSWNTYADAKLSKFMPYSLKLVNQALADGLNRFEASARLVCYFLEIDTDETADWLLEEDESEYSNVYYCFNERPRRIFDRLNLFADQGHIRSIIRDSIDETSAALFEKYPELRKDAPPEPERIEWWELSYNDAQKDNHGIAGQFESASEVVEYIATKEGTKDLFWQYPLDLKYSDWDPTMPPHKDWNENRIFAIPKRGWSVLWEKYSGIGFGANFDHWEAIKQHAYVRPKDKDAILHTILEKTYQMEMTLDSADAV